MTYLSLLLSQKYKNIAYYLRADLIHVSKSIQVSELRTDDPEANRRGTRGLRQIPRSSRHSSHSTKALTNLQAQQSGEGQLLPRLFQLLPNLRSLSLSMHRVINSHNYRAIGTGLSSQSSGWLGSEVDLMASLCSLKTLRRLSLWFVSLLHSLAI